MRDSDRSAVPPTVFQRVLLPMTMAESLRPTLAFAARCAQALALPLEALFIEDEELLALAGLPFARATSWRAMERPWLDVATVVDRLASDARRVRRMLDAEASALALAARFAIVRADLRQALANATRASDLLVLGGGMLPFWDSRARRELILQGAAGGLLVLEPRVRPCQAISALYGTEADDAALLISARLASGLAATLNVVLLCRGPAEAEELRRRALGRLGRLAPPTFIVLSPERFDRLTDALPSSIGELLVLPADRAAPLLEDLVTTARGPRRSILIVRAE